MSVLIAACRTVPDLPFISVSIAVNLVWPSPDYLARVARPFPLDNKILYKKYESGEGLAGQTTVSYTLHHRSLHPFHVHVGSQDSNMCWSTADTSLSTLTSLDESTGFMAEMDEAEVARHHALSRLDKCVMKLKGPKPTYRL